MILAKCKFDSFSDCRCCWMDGWKKKKKWMMVPFHILRIPHHLSFNANFNCNKWPCSHYHRTFICFTLGIDTLALSPSLPLPPKLSVLSGNSFFWPTFHHSIMTLEPQTTFMADLRGSVDILRSRFFVMLRLICQLSISTAQRGDTASHSKKQVRGSLLANPFVCLLFAQKFSLRRYSLW